MAKFSRFDPRNKNRDRNKVRSLNKDIRIRAEEGKLHRQNWKTKDWTYDRDVEEWGDEDQYERS